MSGNDFLKMVNDSKHLELIRESETKYIVCNHDTNKKYEIKKDAVTSTNWENIRSVLAGREPMILDGITRIVGYFSKVSNWNKSKLGELKDRRKGNYKVGSFHKN